MALTIERKTCPRCGRQFNGRPSDKLCGICSAAAPAGAFQDKNDINQRNAIRDYIRAHPGATDSEIINNLGVSKRMLRDMSKASQTVKNGIYHPCGKCGKKILNGVYCPECLATLRNNAKLQGERNEYHKRIMQEEQVTLKTDNVILIVDCDDLHLNLTKNILELGMPTFKIQAANNSLKAINVMHGLKTRLLLLDDATTRNYDGLSFLRNLRNDELCKNVKVIMTTVMAKKENVARGLLLGALDYINKPFDPKDLIERVNKVLFATSAIDFTSRMIFKILIIDDNPTDIDIEKELVQKNFSCEVLVAHNGVEGLWVLDENSVDLIMISLNMQFMDGLKTLSYIRRDDKLRGIPVILMTSSSEQIVDNVSSSLVRGYIKKPNFDSEDLLLIKNALNEGKYWRK